MKGYRFRHRLKVRFSEVDAARIVFHSHYLNYFDVAATEYFAEGLKIKRHEQTMKGTFSYILKKSMLEYHNQRQGERAPGGGRERLRLLQLRQSVC